MREALTLRNIDVLRGPSLLAFAKLAVFSVHVCVFLFLHSMLFLFVRNEKRRLRLILKSNAFHGRIVCRYLGIESFHDEQTEPVRGKLIICNHMSYVDVLVLFVRYPALFITSKEIEQTPVLGQITKLAGCFFTERRKHLLTPESSLEEMKLMKKRLSEGFNIFLFPEGTSSDGKSVLPFKAHFFQLAIDNNIMIQPLMVKYLGANRNVAPWYGDMDFVPHFLEVCRQSDISVSVHQLPKISPAGKEKFQLRDEAHTLIKDAYERH